MYIENRAQRLVAIAAHCLGVMKGDNQMHINIWESILDSINAELPRGSGFDSGSEFDIEASKHNRLVFNTSFHHMNECGMYDGWTEHQVILTPTFDSFNIRVTGRGRNGIKDYIAESFHEVLNTYYVTEATREDGKLTMDIRRAAFDYGFVKGE